MKPSDEMINSLLERREKYIADQKRKRTIAARTAVSLCGVCLAVGLVFGLGHENRSDPTPELPENTAISSRNETTDDVQLSVQSTEADATEEKLPEESSAQVLFPSVDKPAVDPSDPPEGYDPPFEKTYVDNSPEKKLADLKEILASGRAFSQEINAEKKQLEARKADILSSVKGDAELMSASQSAEMAQIDERLEEIWLNYSTDIDDPDYYDYEKFFVHHMTDTITEETYFLERGYFAPDSHEYYHNTGLVEICTQALEMYNNGATVDEAYLYYYQCLDKLILNEW